MTGARSAYLGHQNSTTQAATLLLLLFLVDLTFVTVQLEIKRHIPSVEEVLHASRRQLAQTLNNTDGYIQFGDH